jgi:hypothetical protein
MAPGAAVVRPVAQRLAVRHPAPTKPWLHRQLRAVRVRRRERDVFEAPPARQTAPVTVVRAVGAGAEARVRGANVHARHRKERAHHRNLEAGLRRGLRATRHRAIVCDAPLGRGIGGG